MDSIKVMRTILLRIFLFGIAIILVVSLMVYMLLPKQPESWNEITLGMSSAEVYALAPEFSQQGWRAVKGFDLMTVKRGDDYWQYMLYYDKHDKVERTEKRLYCGALDMFIINRVSD